MIFRGPRASIPTETTIHYKAPDLYEHAYDTASYVMTRQSNNQQGYISTGILATTGSNIFVGNQIISGNLDVTGTLTANQLNYNYTATGSIYMTGSIETVDHIDFSVTADPLHQEGRLHWNDDAKTLDIDTPTLDFMIEIGQMMVVRGRNTNPFTLTKGTVVYMSGSSGTRPNFFTASYSGERTSASTLGIIAQDITQNQTGYVISMGTLRGINTNAYLPGTPLYLSSSGQFSKEIPVSPNHEVRLGKVVTSATDGIIYVDIMNGYEIGELHDVLDNTTSTTYGDILYRSGSVWTNTDDFRISGSYVVLSHVSESLNFADDSAAAIGGVPAGGLYHTNGTIKIRLV